MRPLIIGEEQKQALQRVLAYARLPHHWYRVGPGGHPKSIPPGDIAAHRLELPVGFHVVFSYSLHESAGKVFRHLSVSVDNISRIPNLASMAMIGEELGFKEWPISMERPPLNVERPYNTVMLAEERGEGYAAVVAIQEVPDTELQEHVA